MSAPARPTMSLPVALMVTVICGMLSWGMWRLLARPLFGDFVREEIRAVVKPECLR